MHEGLSMIKHRVRLDITKTDLAALQRLAKKKGVSERQFIVGLIKAAIKAQKDDAETSD